MTFKQDYSEYLQSKHWKDLAEETRRLAGYRCQVCNSEDRLEIHPRTYERKGDEYQSDLVCLCHECHERFHKRTNKTELLMTRLVTDQISEIVYSTKNEAWIARFEHFMKHNEIQFEVINFYLSQFVDKSEKLLDGEEVSLKLDDLPLEVING